MPDSYQSEVLFIRKIILTIFALMMLLSAAPQAQAAASDSRAGIVTTASTSLFVRSRASSASSVLTTLKKGSYVTLISKSGDWWKVEYAKGKYGFCHGDYISITQGTPASVKTKSTGLNVRSGAGTSYIKLDNLSRGETVLFLSESSGWSRVLYHGTKTGYVSAQYLSNYLSAVSLQVPSFKQMDSRWADVIVGESGKPFSQIGCATTGIAMMESYRNGRTIYPDVMMKDLRYTPSGDVYWPSHYTVVTKQAEYLSVIYQKLQQGKPVLLGARNASGAQHWVVITGFSGGASLSTAAFTIQDPGTYNRKNLQQFLNVYPNFYKYFHY